MAATTDWVKKINDKYNASNRAQQVQLKAGYDKAAKGYQKQIGDAPKAYQTLRNGAYTDNAIAERSRREAMANMGLSGAGGTSQTFQQRNTNALLNTLGDASRQQKDYTDNVNLALANLQMQYDVDIDSLTAKTEAERNGAVLSENHWQSNYDLQKQKFAKSVEDGALSENHWQSNYDLQKQKFAKSVEDGTLSENHWQSNYDLQKQKFAKSVEDGAFSQAYKLYADRRITKAQFQEMTGVRLR